MGTGRKVVIGIGIFMGLSVLGQITGITKQEGDTPAAQPAAVAAQAAAQQPVPPPPPRQAMNATARALAKFYEANEVAADQQYKGQLVAVSGTVTGIDKDFMDNIIVKLAGDQMFREVWVYVGKGEEAKAASLAKGVAVTATGQCDGRIVGNVLIRGAVLR